MYQEAIELFQRVDVKSNSGPGTSVRLEELNTASPQRDQIFLSQELLGICENLIPSRVHVRSVRH